MAVTREELIAEARRRGLIGDQAQQSPRQAPSFSREQLVSEARRRGLLPEPKPVAKGGLGLPPLVRPGQPEDPTVSQAMGELREQFIDPALRGARQGLMDIGQGAKQLGLDVGSRLGLTDSQAVQDYTQEVLAQRQAYEQQPGAQTGLAKAGRFVSNVAPFAAIPLGGASTLARTAIGAGAGAAMGAAEFAPTEDRRLANIALGGTIGAVAPLATQAARSIRDIRLLSPFRKALEDFRGRFGREPSAIPREIAEAEIIEPTIRKGMRLERQISERSGKPMRFTLSELTGGREQGQFEALAARTSEVDTFFQFQQKQLRSNLDALDNTLRRVSPEDLDKGRVGELVKNRMSDVTKRLDTLRRAQANDDFARVYSLAGDQPVMGVDDTVSTMQSWLERLQGRTAGGAMSAERKRLTKTLERYVSPDGQPLPMNAREIQNELAYYTQAARGEINIFRETMGSKRLSMRIAGDIKRALLRDLDEAAASGAGDVADALRLARSNYRNVSEQIAEVRKSSLGRILKSEVSSVEDIANKIIKLDPSQIRQTTKILEKHAPELVKVVQRSLVDDALQKAITGRIGAEIVTPEKFSAAKFIRNLPSVRKLRAAGMSRKDISEIYQVGSALERIMTKQFQGSPTAPFMVQLDNLMRAGEAAAEVATVRPGSALKEVIGNMYAKLMARRIAHAALTPEGRKAFLDLASKTGQPRRESLAAIETMITAEEAALQGISVDDIFNQ